MQLYYSVSKHKNYFVISIKYHIKYIQGMKYKNNMTNYIINIYQLYSTHIIQLGILKHNYWHLATYNRLKNLNEIDKTYIYHILHHNRFCNRQNTINIYIVLYHYKNHQDIYMLGYQKKVNNYYLHRIIDIQWSFNIKYNIKYYIIINKFHFIICNYC